MSLWSAIFGRQGKQVRQLQAQVRGYRNRLSAITAANTGGGGGGWMGMPSDEDAANKEYAKDRGAIVQRAQDLDVNNPDVGGFNRTRTGQILDAGVFFKHVPRARELGLTAERAAEISTQIDRLRELHGKAGGFDSQKGKDWEGKRQEKAMLTALVYGSCLIHRVWKQGGRGGGGGDRLLPLSIELIPGSRITTPYDKYGDPRVSFGVRYTDEHRDEVEGYYVRRVSQTIGNSFIPDFTWDLLPAEDCSLLELTEPAGIDQALPLCTRIMRTARNRGEFVENTIESARAQSRIYAVTTVAAGASPFDVAQDDRQSEARSAKPLGFIPVDPSVRMMYAANGETVQPFSVKLPEPAFEAFMDATDERMARGLNSSKSRFTRRVNSSWAGGRLEDQQDDPLINQYRAALCAAWHKVNGWFLEAVWLTGVLEGGLPGYSRATRVYWNQFRAEFIAKVEVNPVDTAKASEQNLMIRRTSPQREIERAGGDADVILDEWAKWQVKCRDKETEYDLKPGSMDILFPFRAVTTQAGEDVTAPSGNAEQEGEESEGKDAGKKKRPQTENRN